MHLSYVQPLPCRRPDPSLPLSLRHTQPDYRSYIDKSKAKPLVQYPLPMPLDVPQSMNRLAGGAFSGASSGDPSRGDWCRALRRATAVSTRALESIIVSL